MFNSCGNRQESPSTGTSESKTDSSTSVSEEISEPKNYWEMLDEVSDSSELPDWAGEKLEVNVWVAGGTDAVFGTISDTNVVVKEIERVTGITFNVDKCFGNGGDNIDAKLPRLVASKDFPTLVYGWDIDLGVLWGFRKREELEENGADAIIAQPLEALGYI